MLLSSLCRCDQEVWVSHVKLLLRECREACHWFMERMEAEGGRYLKYVTTLHTLDWGQGHCWSY